MNPSLVVAALLLAGCATPSGDLPAAVPADHLEVFGAEDDPVLGDLDAPVLVLAWEAPACSVCKHFHLGGHEGGLRDLRTTYLDTGRAVYVSMQWTVGSGYDMRAGVALECMHRQAQTQGQDASAYFDLKARIYAHQFDEDAIGESIRKVADAHDLDVAAIETCTLEQETLPAVQQDIEEGAARIGSRSPGFLVLVEGQVSGPFGPAGLLERLQEVA